MAISVNDVKKYCDITGASILEAKNALENSGGDIALALKNYLAKTTTNLMKLLV